MANITEISDKTFNDETGKGLVITDFNADWCPPCKMMNPILEKLSSTDELGDKIKFTSMNVDHNPDTPNNFGIQGIPTFIIKKDGNVVGRMVGYQPEAKFRMELEKYMDQFLFTAAGGGK